MRGSHLRTVHTIMFSPVGVREPASAAKEYKKIFISFPSFDVHKSFSFYSKQTSSLCFPIITGYLSNIHFARNSRKDFKL